jgi:hypothetical protein
MMSITVRGYWGKPWAYLGEETPGPTQEDTTRTLQSSISIRYLYMRSLRNNIDDIVHIVEDFDMVCYTETHLDQRVPTNNLVVSYPFVLLCMKIKYV